MRRWRYQRGEGNLGCILWLAVLCVAVLVAWKAIPVKMTSTKMYNHIDELAKFAAATTPPDAMKKMILDKANELEITLAPEDVFVGRKGDNITIDVKYIMPVEVLGFKYQWHFHHHLDRQIFIV